MKIVPDKIRTNEIQNNEQFKNWLIKKKGILLDQSSPNLLELRELLKASK